MSNKHSFLGEQFGPCYTCGEHKLAICHSTLNDKDITLHENPIDNPFGRISETPTIETSSGAKSSDGAPKFHLLSGPAIRGLVKHLTDGTTGSGGAVRYGEGNWEKGISDRAFLLDRINHLQEHLIAFLETPNMTKAEMQVHWRGVGCNWMFIMHAIETGTIPKDMVYKW